MPECPKSLEKSLPKDPPVLKLVRRVNLLQGQEFAEAIAKRYREVWEVLVFLKKKGKKTVQIVKLSVNSPALILSKNSGVCLAKIS